MWKLLQFTFLIIFYSSAEQPKTNAKISNSNNFCSAFNKIIEESYSNFNALKGKTVQNNNGFWRNVYCVATVSLPGTKECRITENLFTCYECTVGQWNTYTPIATKEYEKFVVKIKQCLPAGWASHEEKNISSSILQFECFESSNKQGASKPRIIVRLFKISAKEYQLDFKAVAPITE